MSYTMFTGTAICQVPSFFDLDNFIKRLHRKCILDDNFIVDNYGVLEVTDLGFKENGPTVEESEPEVDVDFNEYISHYGNKIYLKTDSEENDSDVWSWLIEQFLTEMCSDVMVIKTATVDSRTGTDVDVCLKSRTGTTLTLEDLIENYPGLTKESYNLY